MPYEYSKLTTKEKQEVLRIRSERGYPLHRPPHPIREPGYYHITAACYKHMEIISPCHRRTDFEIRLLDLLESINSEVIAWVILPNHYHFLAKIDKFEDFPSMIGRLHGSTSFKWNREDSCIGRKVWYRYSDRYIRTKKQMYHVFNYIHFNAVKHNYVQSPYDWIWSSLDLYRKDRGRAWLQDLWRKYPADELSLE